MLALVVRIDLVNEAAAAPFDALLAEMVGEVTAHEPGALVYAVHTVEGEPLARVLYEVYADEAAFQAHQDAAYFKAFLAARTPLMAQRRGERLSVVAAKGLDA
jgi:quinol monooxygenase YgiN